MVSSHVPSVYESAFNGVEEYARLVKVYLPDEKGEMLTVKLTAALDRLTLMRIQDVHVLFAAFNWLVKVINHVSKDVRTKLDKGVEGKLRAMLMFSGSIDPKLTVELG